jgi:molecular chaperone IbpA|tara:strand:+ start:216 stop:695 length:480 start_codon:yes stop_codon:yes gene_type:complete
MVSVDFDWANWKAHELDQFNTGLIGIDRIFDQFKQTQQNVQTNYPPYNIVKVGKDNYKYVIEMAVAGHTMDSIDVTVEKQILTVKGAGAEKTDTDYIHKGISQRGFTRTFTLADTIKVKGANIVNGILYIELENVIPEEDKPKTIKIGASKPQLLLEDK